MLFEIPPHLSISDFMRYLKSKSSLILFDRYGKHHFGCRGYFVDTVGKYEKAIKEYIKNQFKKIDKSTYG